MDNSHNIYSLEAIINQLESSISESSLMITSNLHEWILQNPRIKIFL